MADSPQRPSRSRAPPGGVAEAMNRVLAAERDALAEVEAARLEAERTLEAARREARSVLARAERVARDIHGRTARLAAARARRLMDAGGASSTEIPPRDVLVEAVSRLAARMTGGGDDA